MSPNRDQRSRRALLAGAAAGVAAIAVGSLARPLPVRAGIDGDVVLGIVNTSASTTTLRKTSGDAAVLMAENNYGPAVDANSDKNEAIRAVSDTGVAISAVSKHFIGIVGWGGEPHLGGGSTPGVQGMSGSGDGVIGMSKDGVGVHGSSDTGTGVYAHSRVGWGVTGSSEGTEFGHAGGVFGMSDRTVGVFGLSAQGIAVEGRSDHDPATGIGVKGFSRLGIGVNGESETGIGVEGRTLGTTTEEGMFQANVIGVWGRVDGPDGFGIAVKGDGANGCGVLGQGGHVGVHGYGEKVGVEGKSLDGTGVSGQTNDGVAISAQVFPGGSGHALDAHGLVQFDSAGRGQLVGGRAHVTPGVALHDGSKVLVTLMGNPGAQALVPYVEVMPGPAGTGFFRVRVPNARATAIPFAYFVIN
jgi:hypothetical protein